MSGGARAARRGHRRGGHDRRRGGRDRAGPDTADRTASSRCRPGIRQSVSSAQRRTSWPSPGILLGAALTTAPLAFRRTYPITSFCVIMVAVIVTSGHTTSITFAAVICAAYSAVAYSPYRRAALLSVLAAAVIVDGGLPGHLAPGAGTLWRAAGTAADGGGRGRDTRLAPPGRGVRRAPAPREGRARGADPARRRAGAGPYRQRDARRGDAQRERDGGAGGRGPAGAGQLAGRGPRGAAGRRGQRADRHDRTAAPARPAGTLRGGSRGRG